MNRKEKTVIIGMVGNFVLASAKTFLSLISGSAALIADALHSFSDLLVSLLVLGGLKFNKKRIEAIVSLIVGFLILSVAIGFALELYSKDTQIIKNITWAVTGQIIIIIGTFILYKYKEIIGKEENSESLIADGSHTKSDMFSSIGVLVSLVGTLVGLNLDRVAAFIIFFLILYQGLQTIGGALGLLRGKNNESPFMYSFPFGKNIIFLCKKTYTYINHNKKRSILFISLFIVLIYFIPAIYIVDESEEGVKTFIGKVQKETIKPGLHVELLYFLSSINKIETDKIRTIEYGFKKEDRNANDVLINQWETIHNSRKYSPEKNEENLLTGDGSIININLILEYKIIDPIAYTITTTDPQSILRIETGAKLQKITGSMDLFTALNNGRITIEKELKKQLNRSMFTLNSGLFIEDILIFSIHPHLETAYIFRHVQDEEQYKDTLLYDAEAIKERTIPYYRGLAYEKISNAEAEAKEIILKAESESLIYKTMEKEFINNKEALIFRLANESRNRILNSSEKILIDDSLKKNLIRIDRGRED